MNKENAGKKPVQPNHRLRQARTNKGFSQQEVADSLGIFNTRSIRRWEDGTSFPRSYYRRKLAELFGQSLEELGLISSSELVSTQSEEKSFPDNPARTLINVDVSESSGNIPPWFTSFIGRTAEIARIRALLTMPEIRLVTILGSGGVGKTRLAVEVARVSQIDFPDGICQISLAAIRDPVLVLPTIAKELQLQDEGKGALIKNLQGFFEKRRFLLILDNFEHILAAGPLIEELLGACSGLKVLVTSQIVLHLQAEHEFTLDPFPLPGQDVPPDNLPNYYAIQLFIQRTQAHISTFEATPENLSLIGKICACLDGLPLAIELATTRVKLLGLPSLLQELSKQRLRILRSGIKTPLVRHQALIDTIQWNYNHLDEQEKWFFRHLALFTGGCSLIAARRLSQISPFQTIEVLDVLMSLIDKNMIRSTVRKGDIPFFSMLETIREYGISVLQQLDEWDTARQTHADYYLTLLAEAESSLKGIQQGLWLTYLDNERENLRSALTWLIERQETEQALSFCEVFGKYCGLRGYWSEELHWLETVLALSKTKPSTKLHGRILRRAGYIIYRLRDLERAFTFFEESAAISETFDDLSNLAGSFNGLAWVYYRQGHIAAARHNFQRSVDVARRSGDNWSLANALESLGRFMYAQGDIQAAILHVEESISLARTIEDRESLVRQLSAFIPIKIAQGLFEEAEALARESFSYALALENKPLIGMALTGMADTAFAQNSLDSAKDLYERLNRLASEMDDKPTIAHVKLKLSYIALKQKDLEQATILAQVCLAFFQSRGDKPNITLASHILEDIHQITLNQTERAQ
jgi:predicted ATPase/DNA-binding XRE family transcriptional regulator